MDRLHGILTAYEMRTRKEQPDLKDAAFKAYVKLSISQDHDSSEHFLDEEEDNFVRKMKRSFGEYKGMLPFKCFHCDKVGHFVSRCPFKENNTNKKERKSINKLKKFKMKKSFKRKNFYSKKISTILHILKKKNMSQIHLKMKNFSQLWSNKIFIKKY
jgi:hypothetical protein